MYGSFHQTSGTELKIITLQVFLHEYVTQNPFGSLAALNGLRIENIDCV